MLKHFHQNNFHESYHRISPIIILLIQLFQFSYTCIFGVYSSFLFIRTAHFIPSFILHSLCNSLGIPDIIRVRNMQDSYRRRRFFVLICYFIDICLFSMNLFYLTQSKFYYLNDNNLMIYRYWSS
jgi:prenyl protein peptidase